MPWWRSFTVSKPPVIDFSSSYQRALSRFYTEARCSKTFTEVSRCEVSNFVERGLCPELSVASRASAMPSLNRPSPLHTRAIEPPRPGLAATPESLPPTRRTMTTSGGTFTGMAGGGVAISLSGSLLSSMPRQILATIGASNAPSTGVFWTSWCSIGARTVDGISGDQFGPLAQKSQAQVLAFSISEVPFPAGQCLYRLKCTRPKPALS